MPLSDAARRDLATALCYADFFSATDGNRLELSQQMEELTHFTRMVNVRLGGGQCKPQLSIRKQFNDYIRYTNLQRTFGLHLQRPDLPNVGLIEFPELSLQQVQEVIYEKYLQLLLQKLGNGKISTDILQSLSHDLHSIFMTLFDSYSETYKIDEDNRSEEDEDFLLCVHSDLDKFIAAYQVVITPLLQQALPQYHTEALHFIQHWVDKSKFVVELDQFLLARPTAITKVCPAETFNAFQTALTQLTTALNDVTAHMAALRQQFVALQQAGLSLEQRKALVNPLIELKENYTIKHGDQENKSTAELQQEYSAKQDILWQETVAKSRTQYRSRLFSSCLGGSRNESDEEQPQSKQQKRAAI